MYIEFILQLYNKEKYPTNPIKIQKDFLKIASDTKRYIPFFCFCKKYSNARNARHYLWIDC